MYNNRRNSDVFVSKLDCTAHGLAIAKQLNLAFLRANAKMSKDIDADCILRIIAHATELFEAGSLSLMAVLSADASPTAVLAADHGPHLEIAICTHFVIWTQRLCSDNLALSICHQIRWLTRQKLISLWKTDRFHLCSKKRILDFVHFASSRGRKGFPWC